MGRECPYFLFFDVTFSRMPLCPTTGDESIPLVVVMQS